MVRVDDKRDLREEFEKIEKSKKAKNLADFFFEECDIAHNLHHGTFSIYDGNKEEVAVVNLDNDRMILKDRSYMDASKVFAKKYEQKIMRRSFFNRREFGIVEDYNGSRR